MAETRQRDRDFPRRPRILDYVGLGRVQEDEARSAAENLVRRVRSESMRRVEGTAPDPASVRERHEALHEPDEDR
jgi:hypothetical protein